MPRKEKAKKMAKKAASRKPLRKAAKKKAIKKKSVAPKQPSKRKIAKKKIIKKKLTPLRKKALPAKPLMVEPGPPPRVIPPVEEPISNEEAIGAITHYYSHLLVAVVQINKGTLRIGDNIHIKGHSTNFSQTVESMEFEHSHVDQAAAGQSVGIKVNDHVREHDILYLVK